MEIGKYHGWKVQILAGAIDPFEACGSDTVDGLGRIKPSKNELNYQSQLVQDFFHQQYVTPFVIV